MSVAGSGSDGIQLVDIKLNDDNIAVASGADRQMDRNTSHAR